MQHLKKIKSFTIENCLTRQSFLHFLRMYDCFPVFHGCAPLPSPARYNGPTLERPVYRLLHLLFALGLAHALFLLGQEGVRAHRLAQEQAELEARLRQAEARVAALRAQVEAAKDPVHLEALARRLGMVRKEEILKRR